MVEISLSDDTEEQTLAPKPIDLSQDLRSTVEARTISEDTEDVGDIAAGLLRAYQGQAAETGGPPQITDVDQLTQRATDIERAIERLPGEEDALGLARTTFSIGKFLVWLTPVVLTRMLKTHFSQNLRNNTRKKDT